MNHRSRIARAAPRLLIVALFFAALSQVVAQSPAAVRVSPTQSQVVAGQTVDIAVEVVDVSDLYGTDLQLTFDPTVVEVVDLDPMLPGIQVALGLFLDPGFVLRNTADNTAGTLHFAMTQLAPSSPKSGTGNLIVIRFLGKQAGAGSDLAFTSAQLAGPGGVPISGSPVSGSVAVTSSSAGPTATPIPSQGPGTPLPTNTPTATPAPSTPAPLTTPTATASVATPTLPPATPIPVGTAVPPSPVPATESPTPPPSTATSAPPGSPTAAPTATALLPTDTSQPPAAASPTAVHVTARPGAEGEGDAPVPALLWTAAVALGLAALLAAVAVALLWRRGRAGGR